MAQADITDQLNSVGADGYVSSDDVLFLRRQVFQNGVVCVAELDALFQLAQAAPDGDSAWPQYFAEAAADHYLRAEEPHGYLTSAQFRQLETQITHDGRQAGVLEMSLLVHLLKNALCVPADMVDFVTSQLNAYFAGKKNGPCICEQDVIVLRDFLHAAGGAGSVGITREEAEFLFDLHDLTADAENHESWPDLFIKAIAAHLMQHIGYKPLSREKALRLHHWVKDTSINPAGVFSRMINCSISDIRDAYTSKSVRSRRNDEDEIAAAITEQVAAREAEWLAERIQPGGRVNEVERALIDYLKNLDTDLPPKLRALVQDAA